MRERRSRGVRGNGGEVGQDGHGALHLRPCPRPGGVLKGGANGGQQTATGVEPPAAAPMASVA
eukprot:8549553-Heterocapsa_arctica.AAC.1